MRRAARALALAAPLAVAPVSADACVAAVAGQDDQRLESPAYVVAYRTRPGPIVLGQHFSIDLVVCPRGDAPAPEGIRVDAHMPEHRHGMNYRPVVTAGTDGRYRADGLLFHMAGRWELVFEVRGAGRTERLTRSLELE